MGKRKKVGRIRTRGGAYGPSMSRLSSRSSRFAVSDNSGNNKQPEFTENGEPGPVEPGGGVLELHPNGYGFLRDPKNNYM
ncbi:MAG: transcription termination factor Rho, partial [Thermoguttaceae bacterium]